jgi:aminoglycoside phosphotransferase (APT) family kinase protein
VTGLAGDDPIVRARRLRRWGASEVWRVEFGGAAPRSVIVKRGTAMMRDEARRYRELVIPLGAEAPRLLTATEDADSVVLLLADAGPDNLEDRPTADGYREAVRTLVRMRSTATGRLAADPSIGAGRRMTTGDFAEAALRVGAGLAGVRRELARDFAGVEEILAERLDRHQRLPDTLVHGDFHAKNLVAGPGGRIVVVDWTDAYLHPHLGDLYCLIREADNGGLDVGAETLPALFAAEAGVEPATVRELMLTGGLCWTVLVLDWLVEEGLTIIPESRDWLDGLVADCRRLAAPSA